MRVLRSLRTKISSFWYQKLQNDTLNQSQIFFMDVLDEGALCPGIGIHRMSYF